MNGPTVKCSTRGCGGLTWRDGGECRKCLRVRLANDRTSEPLRVTLNRRRVEQGLRPLGVLDPDLAERARVEGYATEQEGE